MIVVVVVVFTDRQTFTKSLRRKAIYSGKTRRSPFYGDVESNMSMLIETPTTTLTNFHERLTYGDTNQQDLSHNETDIPPPFPCGGSDRPLVSSGAVVRRSYGSPCPCRRRRASSRRIPVPTPTC